MPFSPNPALTTALTGQLAVRICREVEMSLFVGDFDREACFAKLVSAFLFNSDKKEISNMNKDNCDWSAFLQVN